MHRVELKAERNTQLGKDEIPVPNAPCGVERIIGRLYSVLKQPFLMQRVELKALFYTRKALHIAIVFLMHRVELKEG